MVDEHYEIKLGSLALTLVNNALGIPIFTVAMPQAEASFRRCETLIDGKVSVSLNADYFNQAMDVAEPLLEPVDVVVKVRRMWLRNPSITRKQSPCRGAPP